MDARAEFKFALENGDEIVFSRRDGLRYALSGFLTFTSVPALQVPGPALPPGVPSGAAVVTAFGAKGNGEADDTAAIQKALDSGNPNVVFPAGKVYRVQGGGTGDTRVPDCPLKVRSNTMLLMAGATVKLAPNQREFTSVFHLLDVHDVTFRGGRVDGSKDQHKPVTNRGQNGGLHGFSVDGGKRIAFYDVVAADCFTDGWLLRMGVADVTMERCQGLGNRRQGISIIEVNGLVCRKSKFANTAGQEPQAGVDIEPDHASEKNYNLLFEDCEFVNNMGRGLTVNCKSILDGLTVRRCKFAGNRHVTNVDIGVPNRNGVISNVIIEDCDIEMRVDLYGRDPTGAFVDWVIRSNRLRGPKTGIRTHGFTPTAKNSVRITGNQITSGLAKRWAIATENQPGVHLEGNTYTRLT